MIDLAFALRDHMRRSGPARYQDASGGGTVELRAISHRGFVFEVRRRTYIWEQVRPLVLEWKERSIAFHDLLEMQRDITWVDAIRAQDALRAIWQKIKPVDPEGVAWS